MLNDTLCFWCLFANALPLGKFSNYSSFHTTLVASEVRRVVQYVESLFIMCACVPTVAMESLLKCKRVELNLN